jgi:hypothetical protein
MNKLKDAPELRKAFNGALDELIFSSSELAHQINLEVAEHFFIAGRDSLRDECDSVRPKRKIVQLLSHNGELHALCSEGKVWVYEQILRDCQWYMAGDLPKDVK